MTLIKSISGIRGTIGGREGDNLTPSDIVKFVSAYARLIKDSGSRKRIVIGRDARTTGDMVSKLVAGTLMSMGMDVIDLGLSTTPTVEMAVTWEQAGGGIIITASHNPSQWNALKLLNHKGEFISADEGKLILELAAKSDFEYAIHTETGQYETRDGMIDKHIEAILEMELVNRDAIAEKKYKIVVDCVNSTGGIAVPKLLKALGVEEVIELYTEPNGIFPHNPEPLPENLTEIAGVVNHKNADLGIVVDPDVDRLAIVNEDGSMFGEEYTLVAVADYVIKHQPGNTVSNLSSTRALKDVTEKSGNQYFASKVGEVNVVEKMKETQAVIGGEGNGGVIYPALHYGRDALMGIALFLSHLATSGKYCSLLKSTYPEYHISKNKLNLDPEINLDGILNSIKTKYKQQPMLDIDGLKIEFDMDWVHLRKSNTEPVIRIYAESNSESTADNIARKIVQDIRELL
jgi:phosphomannomutase